MIPLFIEKLSKNMQNLDFKLNFHVGKTDEIIEKYPLDNSQQNKIFVAETSTTNNQKQKEAISNKYNIQNSINNMNNTKNICNNFNVIDEINEEDNFSRTSVKMNNPELDYMILKSSDTKISEKLKKKIQNNLNDNKVKDDKKPISLRSGNNAKSSANFISQNSKIKNYIKQNKQKINNSECPFLSINTEPSLPCNNEVQSTSNLKSSRVSPDTASRNNYARLDKQIMSKGKEYFKSDSKIDDKRRLPSKTPPKFLAEKLNSKENYHKDISQLTSKQGFSNRKNISISPDIKKEYSDKKDKIKKIKISENNIKKEKIEKNEKDKEIIKGKKINVNLNMNIKKTIKNTEKEINQNYMKTEESIPLNKKTKTKIQEKQIFETINYSYSKNILKESRRKRYNLEDIYKFEGLGNLNFDVNCFYEFFFLFNEISSISNQYSQISNELSKNLKELINSNKNESGNCNFETKKQKFLIEDEDFSKKDAAQIIQRKWRNYKLSNFLEIPSDKKNEIILKSKLILMDCLIKNPEFKKLISSLTSTIQMWKELTYKQPNIKKATNAISSDDELNYYHSLSDFLGNLQNINKEIRLSTLELDKL